MSDLPARLEAAAPEWDSRVDAEIALAIGWYRDENDEWHAVGWFFEDDKLRSTSYAVDLPPFTRSVDAALALLDMTGHQLWTMTTKTRSFGQHGMSYDVEITIPSREFQGRSSASLPLAICAAALRARAG